MDLDYEVARMKVGNAIRANDQETLQRYQPELNKIVYNEKVAGVACAVFMTFVAIFAIWAACKLPTIIDKTSPVLNAIIKTELGVVFTLAAFGAIYFGANLAGKPLIKGDPLNRARGLLNQVNSKIKA